jgi:mRNA interferase YafQ
MSLEVTFSNKFKKDYDLVKRQNKNIDDLFFLIEILINQKKLDIEYKDHPLKRKYKHCRECHVAPDFNLIYEDVPKYNRLNLIRLGSHANLFKMKKHLAFCKTNCY